MPANDYYHQAVINALVKDGWKITKEQVYIRFGMKRLWIDLRAINAERIAVLIEVKGFETHTSIVEALAEAVGKYTIYKAALRYHEVTEEALYLAVPLAAYNGIFSETMGEWTRREAEINLLVFDPDREEIIEWIPSHK